MTERDKRVAEALSMLATVPDAERLLAILSNAASQPTGANDGPVDLTTVGRDAEQAATLLISTYGTAALDRARLLEKRSDNYFSRMVRQRLEEMQAASPTSPD